MECKIDNVRDMAYQLRELEPNLTLIEVFQIAVRIQHNNMLNAISDEMHEANKYKDELNGILGGNLSTIADSISGAGDDDDGLIVVAKSLEEIAAALRESK